MIKKFLLNKREVYKSRTENNFKRLQTLDKELRLGGDHYAYNVDLLNVTQEQHKKNNKKYEMYSRLCEMLRLEIYEIEYEVWFDRKTITMRGTSEADVERRVRKLKKKKWVNLKRKMNNENKK